MNACIDCKWHLDPRGWFSRTFLPKPRFVDLCTRSEFRNELDGSPTPCETVRINQCDGIGHFTPKLASAK